MIAPRAQTGEARKSLRINEDGTNRGDRFHQAAGSAILAAGEFGPMKPVEGHLEDIDSE